MKYYVQSGTLQYILNEMSPRLAALSALLTNKVSLTDFNHDLGVFTTVDQRGFRNLDAEETFITHELIEEIKNELSEPVGD